MTTTRRGRALVAFGGAAVGALAFVASVTGAERQSTLAAMAEVISGWSFIVAGLIVSSRRAETRAGTLMIALGFVWFGSDLQYLETSFTYTLGQLLQGFQWIVLGHLLATFPTGRAESRLERLTIRALYVFAIPNAIGVLPFEAARPQGCPECPANLLSLHTDPGLSDAMDAALAAGGLVLTLLVGACFLNRWRAASAPARRAFTPVFGGVLVAVAASTMNSISVSSGTLIPSWARQLAFLCVSGGLLVGLLRSWLDRSAVARLVVELGAVSTPDRLREALARALHDPTVELLYWDGNSGGYVDADGGSRKLPAPTVGRAISELGREGEPVAALIHDRSFLDDPDLIEAVGQAARLALENERLQAEVRSQLEELHASRQRIAEAGLSERRRLERDLHDGAQQRLVTLSLAVTLAQERAAESSDPAVGEMLDEVADQLADALSELRELARGIHPMLLTEAGLGVALGSLAERATVSTKLLSVPAERFAPGVEATAYFVVSESLANVAKHSDAAAATISARQEGDVIVVEVIDNGVGGARSANGSGLAGLADRVAALAGSFEVESPRGGGTRITARIPCE